MKPAPHIGRFAPSPTGDLHFGSLVAAVGSYLEAKSKGGAWLLRIEDIDPPREVAGSAQRIIQDLQRLGMEPDGPVLYQSSRLEAYAAATNRLLQQGLAYHCGCSRKDLPLSGVYPGTCRNGIADGKKPRSVRFRVPDTTCEFTDRVRGKVADSPIESCGDFVIRRADGLAAYQLAVVVDDDYQGVTEVVRGSDLLDSTSRQICLQRALGMTTPVYMHLPVVLSGDGKKLGKRYRADPVNRQRPVHAIRQALDFLGQQPPQTDSLTDLWDWAIGQWSWSLVPSRDAILPL